jgi:hypothetical protein
VAASIAVDRRGYPIVAGAFTGTLEIGGATLTAPIPVPDELDIPSPRRLLGSFFLAGLAPVGCGAFGVGFSPMAIEAESLHIAADGDAILLTAAFHGSVDLGGGPLGPAGETVNGAVARFGADGAHTWSRALVGSEYIQPSRPVPDGQGNVFVGGWFCGTLTFDGAVIEHSAPGLCDGFLLRLDAGGALVWRRTLRLATPPDVVNIWFALSVVAWPSGDVSVSGTALPDPMGDFDLGGGPPVVPPDGGNYVSFVTTFDSADGHRWTRILDPRPGAAALDAAGDRLLATTVLIDAGDNQAAAFLAFDAAGGKPALTLLPDWPDPSDPPGVAAGPDGALLFTGTRQAGGGKPTGLFTLATDAAGKTRWNRTIDAVSPGDVLLWETTLGIDGTALLAGGFLKTVDFPGGARTTTGSAPDAFVVTLAP